ncbi:ATP-binding protein [Anaeromyxobacter soli]|uniref:ATP-binding protein n=1 Tax=Anaeromyxobacter soli TaxID=2922725 RepID=UPI001FB02D78|nr:ATP-binding protein [Anaeromyxobacter sp. SG29]
MRSQPGGTGPILTVAIRREEDVVLARQRARQVARLVGVAASEQTRLATAVSEIARNAWKYASGGKVEIALEDGEEASALVVRVRDQGRGVKDLDAVLSGRYHSPTGMGLGIAGSRRLVDRFDIQSGPSGTTVTLVKDLPPGAGPATPRELAALLDALSRERPHDALEELTTQNQELLGALDALKERERQLVELNRELEDTNRGVVALYAELDEKADYLRRASELKSRFLSNMSHEFRTPLNTVISFCGLLLGESDGPLNDEQRKQIGFARRSAEGMLDLVNDLLDLAKVEAGKTTVRAAPFEVSELFGALRGMLRPLLATTQLALHFEDPVGLPALYTDEGKISQILRNLISNALKFTERGEVRIAARREGGRAIFSVSDTGIGIAPEDQERIFQEYGQLDSPVQRRVRGTGLGLPLSRRLAELLGGRITLQSEPGVGSTFTLDVPLFYGGPPEIGAVPDIAALHDPTRYPVLVVEDNPETIFVYEKFTSGTPFQVLSVGTLLEARRAVQRLRPVAVVLDVMLGAETAWPLLSELKGSALTRGIPVYVVTMVENRGKAKGLGADDFAEKPLERGWLLSRLEEAAGLLPREELLIVDDDEASRYLLRSLLSETRYAVVDVASGEEALRRVAERRPAAVFLDWKMPGMDGGEVLARLRADPRTRDVPVLVYTGEELGPEQRARAAGAAAILAKGRPRLSALHEIREALARLGRGVDPP